MRKARVSVDTPAPSRHDACGNGVLGIAQHVQTVADRAALAYWESRAREWRVSPPLTPAPEDIAWYEARAAESAGAASSRPMRAILLGVTPGIATMRWPEGTSLLAVDWANGMLQHVWPRGGFPERTNVVRSDWRELPLTSGNIDLVIGDGCYAALGSLAGARHLNREIHRILRPGGWYCQRAFCRSDPAPSAAELFEELRAGGVENLDLFRWRLAMSVHGKSAEGVVLGKVWRVWQDHVRHYLEDGAHWSTNQRLNMARWEGVEARFSFPSSSELRALAEPDFDLQAWEQPGYESAEHFPRLLMRARRGLA
jgi:SAM-dependent methyltransferase